MSGCKFTRTGFLIFLLLSTTLIAIAQPTSNYAAQWKNIDALIKKGLSHSALDEVGKIYTAAKKGSNNTQLIKAVLYQVHLQQNLEEDADIKSLQALEKEIKETKGAVKSVLYSIAAERYFNYYQQNRWKLFNRTNIDKALSEQIDTWTSQQLHDKIGQYYQASIANEKTLQQIEISSYNDILVKGNTNHLRPTLYDLLANRALNYFTNDERDIQKPAYAFELNDENVFSPAAQFINYKFKNQDSSSLHFKALGIYQNLLRFHLTDVKPDAFINADIDRLQFTEKYSTSENKTDLYIQGLQQIYTSAKDRAAAQAGYLIAQKIFDEANRHLQDSSATYTFLKARDIAGSVVKKFPQSEGGINAVNLFKTIDQPSLHLTTEKVNVPGKPFRTLVTYKNIATIHLRLISITPAIKSTLDASQDENILWSKLVNEKYIKTWQQTLPLPNDFKSHSAEIKIDQLPIGEYAVLASVLNDFSLNKNPLSVQYFYISNISFVNDNREYFVLHRETGQPLKSAAVQVWNTVYDYKTGKNNLIKQEKIKADNTGYFKLREAQKNENRNIRLEISTSDDRLFLNDNQYNNQYYNNNYEGYNIDDAEDISNYEMNKARVFLFTDRSIYRPGQLVYFKGIAVTNDLKTRRSKLFQSKDLITILLLDANGEKIDSLLLKSNDYSSVTGSFKLPEGRMNGDYIIEAKGFENSIANFSVEEYKRLKFYAEFEKLKGSYRINDSVTVTGFAKAYAGNAINNAVVNYKVRRVARFIYPWLLWRWPMPQTRPLEITHGVITADADGKFKVSFRAIPDLTIDKITEPVFDYEIEADITDAAGETRSTSIIIPVGYKALDVKINMPGSELISTDSIKNISFTAKNLSGEKEAALVTIKVTKLRSPERLIRQRYWEQPDQFVMNREEYLKIFPLDDYNTDLKKENWAKGETVTQITDSANTLKPILNKPLAEGWYVIEAGAKDKDGQEVKDIKYMKVYDDKKTSLPSNAYSYTTLSGSSFQPGDKATIVSGSSATNIFLIQHEMRSVKNNDRDTLQSVYKFSSLNNEKKSFDFNINDTDRGGFTVSQLFVKDNRVYSNTQFINVPWLNKQLDITYTTFRDKTLPGSKEQWKVKISGNKGEKVATEMLAGMYDASLDQFKTHAWQVPDLWPVHYNYNTWNGNQNFNSVTSNNKWVNQNFIEQKEKIYTDFIFSGYNRYNRDVRRELSGAIKGVSVQSDASNYNLQEATVTTAVGVERSEYAKPPVPRLPKEEKLNERSQNPEPPKTIIRKNFNETAFFFPQLNTDKDGNIEFSFTVPEALTTWKLLTLAHTKELAFGYNDRSLVTQKELMIQANAPRFLREGDRMEFSANVTNLNDKEVTGQAELQLFEASTMKPVDGLFKSVFPSQYFTIEANKTNAVKFTLEVPFNFTDALVYRIIAKAGNSSDGEEAALPVLTNRMLVTETLSLNVRGDSVKHFSFEKLLNSGKSETLKSHALTIEFSNNPAWYAIQSLPYLAEPKYDCADYLFNSYYANTLAQYISNASPNVAEVIKLWQKDTANFKSNLQKNEELKSILVQETPWLMEAINETAQMKQLADLFDAAKLNTNLTTGLNKLMEWQSPSGGFVWFKGGPEDRYITQYIISGFARLLHLKAIGATQQSQVKAIIAKALAYLDASIKNDYDNLKKNNPSFKISYPFYPQPIAAQYFYLRSLLPEYQLPEKIKPAYNYYRNQLKTTWLKQTKYTQAMIALAFYRTNDKEFGKAILRSLKENAIVSEELGMYWKDWTSSGYFWYQAPIESQAMMIEAFSEITNNVKTVDDLKTWLLQNKQTNSWPTSKATADACYALLLKGADWLSAEKKANITLGNIIIESDKQPQQAGTGYFKYKIPADKVSPELGKINVRISYPQNTSATATWGGAYWQYFEDLDKISFAETSLKLTKKLFVTKNTDRGPVLQLMADNAGLKVGDKITVRIELRADRDMEYIHMKDMRATCMEPVNVLSTYKYQGGLGYYESTKDAGTNFFFSYLAKGTYVFEYNLFVTHTGNFSNGITTIQCLYAPQFTAHSEGIRVNVE